MGDIFPAAITDFEIPRERALAVIPVGAFGAVLPQLIDYFVRLLYNVGSVRAVLARVRGDRGGDPTPVL